MAEKILIVDDDLETLRLVGLMLERQGYQIHAANSGPRRWRWRRPNNQILSFWM
jgi:CheY-like chemotaxis protein